MVQIATYAKGCSWYGEQKLMDILKGKITKFNYSEQLAKSSSWYS